MQDFSKSPQEHCGGLECAICCTDSVFDAAARVYCRALYHALCAGTLRPEDMLAAVACKLAKRRGHTAANAHQAGQEALRCSANPGYRAEAEKFVIKGDDLIVCSTKSTGLLIHQY
eukprot:5370247-Amphidinium_carterae.1